MFCAHCGSPLAANANTCSKCGLAVVPVDSQTTSQIKGTVPKRRCKKVSIIAGAVVVFICAVFAISRYDAREAELVHDQLEQAAAVADANSKKIEVDICKLGSQPRAAVEAILGEPQEREADTVI